MLNNFNENLDDWIGDQHTVEVSQKYLSTMAIEVMLLLLFLRMLTLFCLQRLSWIGTVPPHMHSAAGPALTQGIVGIPLTQGVISPPLTHGIVGTHLTHGIVGPHLTHGIVGLPSTQGVIGPPSTQGIVSLPSTQGIVSPPLTQDIIGPSSFTPTIGILTSSQSFLGSSQGSSIDIPHALPPTLMTIGMSSQDVPAIGLCHSFMCLDFY